jgi:hypothetical protein
VIELARLCYLDGMTAFDELALHKIDKPKVGDAMANLLQLAEVCGVNPNVISRVRTGFVAYELEYHFCKTPPVCSKSSKSHFRESK